MSRILPIQPPIDFKPKIWTKQQQDDLVRIWQDIATFMHPSGGTGGLVDATTFPGLNAGQQIINAVASLGTAGGIVDARGFRGNQDITDNIFRNIVNPKQVTILLGHANFRTTVSQIAQTSVGLRVIGSSNSGAYVISASQNGSGTIFTWNGAAGGTPFILNYAADCYFSNFVVLPGSGTIGIGLRIDQDPSITEPGAAGTNSTHNIFEYISINQATTSVQIGNVATNGNDLHVFVNMQLIAAGTYGYYLNNAQNKFIKILGGNITTKTHGMYCLAGSFQMESSNFGNNVNDISMGAVSDPVLIQGCQSEGANKFLKALGSSGVSYPNVVTLRNNRTATDNVGADNIYLQYYATGPLHLDNNQFTHGTPLPSVKVDFQASGGVQVVSTSNLWWDKNPFVGTPNDAQLTLTSLGDKAIGASGDSVAMPNLLGNAIGYGGVWITLSNGANDDLAVEGGHYALNYIKVGGPSAAFSISGFSGGRAGRQLQIFNSTAQPMTIRNLTGSAAANQIQTLTGADVTLRAGTSFATFLYDIGLNKWILTSSN